MPGLGGIKFYDSHIKETVKVLDRIKPRFLTFMGINPSVNSRYHALMLKEQKKGENRPLTDKELSQQMITIIDEMSCFYTKIGCFGPNIDQVGHNPLSFNSIQIDNAFKKDSLVAFLNRALIFND